MRSHALTVLVIILLLIAWYALAAPPPGADPDSPIGRWFMSLYQANGANCCDIADCRPAKARWASDHWQVFIDRATFGTGAPDAWMDVHTDDVLQRSDNPFPRGVACWVYGRVFCFVMPPLN